MCVICGVKESIYMCVKHFPKEFLSKFLLPTNVSITAFAYMIVSLSAVSNLGYMYMYVS